MKYIAYYDIKEYSSENRSIALCATNVMTYIMDILKEYESVEVISPSHTRNKSGICKGRKNKIGEKITLVQPFSFGVKTPIGKLLLIAYTRLWLILYLLKNTKKGETVVAYHSLAIMGALKIVKKLKKIKLVLETREIYYDARSEYEEYKGVDMSAKRKKEMQFFKYADKFIFPTEILNDIVNTENKPYLVAPGIYKSEPDYETEKFNDGKIHVVYAGTLRGSKGAMFAIETAEKLPPNYFVHILGSAPKEREDIVREKVEKVNSTIEEGHAQVKFEGLYVGEDFCRFLQKCHIGLAPQDPKAEFNSTSFPSKLFTYLSNGLEVVAVKIPAIEQSPVGKYLNYYEEQTTENLAAAIESVDVNNSANKKEILSVLDKNLREEMRNLIYGK